MGFVATTQPTLKTLPPPTPPFLNLSRWTTTILDVVLANLLGESIVESVMAKLKRKEGRPTLYRPEYCDRLILHCKKGLSYEAFAGVVDVCVDTLYEWEKVHPKFSEAKKKAFAQSRLWWEQQGIDGLYSVTTRDGEGGSSTVSMNSTLWIFQMKNRFPKEWRDRHEIQTEVKITDEVQAQIKSEEEKYLKLMQMKAEMKK